MLGTKAGKAFFQALFLAAAALPAGAADLPDSLALVYDDGAGYTVPYRLFIPPDYDPAIQYPLVLYLHDETGNGTDNLAQIIGEPVGDLIAASQRYGSFLVAPQAPVGTEWYPNLSIILVSEILIEVEAGYSVDERRIYVTGSSMGGIGALMQGYLYPQRYAAAVVIDAAVSPETKETCKSCYEILKDLPMWVFHGALDAIVPVEWARTMVQALRDAGGDPLYTEYPDLGHEAKGKAYADEDDQLYPWLFSQVLASGLDALPFVHDDGAGNTMHYRLFLPPDYDPAVRYPLVLFLHGMGEWGKDNLAQIGPNIMDLIPAARRNGSFLVAPQTPRDIDWLSTRSVNLVSGVLDDVEAGYSVDEKRIYVTGLSMGGFGTLGQIYYFPERYAAAVPISSGVCGADAQLVAHCYNVPIWVFHGALDDVVSVQCSRDIVAALRAAGGEPIYTEYPDRYHDAWFAAYADEDDQLYPWLFSQTLARPEAAFRISPEGADEPLEACFDAGASRSGQGAALLSFQWDFGDGAAGDGAAPCHTYAGPGRYQVGLLVENDLGLQDQATGVVTILCPWEDPLPAPWTCVDVGQPYFPGGTLFEAAGEESCLRICAGGLGVQADQFHLIQKEVAGDFALTARVSEMSGREGSAVGLIVREGSGVRPRTCAILVERGDGPEVTFECVNRYRTVTGALIVKVGKKAGVEVPVTLRIERRGEEVILSRSMDGQTWGEDEVLDRVTFSGLPGTLIAGVAASGRDVGYGTNVYTPLAARVCIVPEAPPPPRFLRADLNDDGSVNITDVIGILFWLFLGAQDPGCAAAANVNGEGATDITDVVYLLGHLYLGGLPPAPPYPGCGPSDLPADEALGCQTAPSHCQAP